MTLFQNRRALVTGGTRGVGLAFAKHLAVRGAEVAITFKNDALDASTASQEIETLSSRKPLLFRGDVADVQHVSQVMDRIESEWGGLDILVCSAGINQFLPLPLIDERNWDEVNHTNLKGSFLFLQAASKMMIRNKYGRILLLGSFSSGHCIDSPAHYAASKAGQHGLAEAFACELGRYNVLINLLGLGLLDQGLSTILPQHRVDQYLKHSAAKRLATPNEIASFAAFLLSEFNTFLTGEKITLDGGVT